MTAEVTHLTAGAPWSGVGEAKTLLDLFVPSCHRDAAPAMIFEDGLVLSRADLLDLTRALRRLSARARVAGRSGRDHGRQPGRVHDRAPRGAAPYGPRWSRSTRRRASTTPGTSCAIRGGPGDRRRGEPRARRGAAGRVPGAPRRARRRRRRAGRPERLPGRGRAARPARGGVRARGHHAHLLHVRDHGAGQGLHARPHVVAAVRRHRAAAEPEGRRRPDALVPAVLLRRSRGHARLHGPQRRHARGDAPLQRVAVLGRRPAA